MGDMDDRKALGAIKWNGVVKGNKGLAGGFNGHKKPRMIE